MHTKSSACMFTAAFFTMDKYSSNRDGRPQASKSVVANPHNGINGRRARPQRPSLNAAQRSQPTILLHTTDRQGQKAGQGCQEGRDGAGGRGCSGAGGGGGGRGGGGRGSATSLQGYPETLLIGEIPWKSIEGNNYSGKASK